MNRNAIIIEGVIQGCQGDGLCLRRCARGQVFCFIGRYGPIVILKQLQSTQKEDLLTNIRQMLVNRVKQYQKYGICGTIPYARDKGSTYSLSDELAHQTKTSKIIQREVPAFFKYMTNYPEDRPKGANVQETYSWASFEVDGLPTFVLVHRSGAMLDENAYTFCERHFYVSRRHNCVQLIGGAFQVENGTFLLGVSRAATDQMTGFGGSMKNS